MNKSQNKHNFQIVKPPTVVKPSIVVSQAPKKQTYNITKGVNSIVPPRVIIYGVEGIGKSTFASRFPNPLVIDVEDRTRHIDTVRYIPNSFIEFMEFLDEFISNKSSIDESAGYEIKTLVIDTIDWLQKHAIEYVCLREGKTSIEEIGYGKGWVQVGEWMQKVIRKLDIINRKGVIIVGVCHSTIRKYEDPSGNTYDRFTLKLLMGDRISVADSFKEWADCLFFMNYLVSKSKVRDEEQLIETRYIMTERTNRYDAKNSYNFEPLVKLDDADKLINYFVERLNNQSNTNDDGSTKQVDYAETEIKE